MSNARKARQKAKRKRAREVLKRVRLQDLAAAEEARRPEREPVQDSRVSGGSGKRSRARRMRDVSTFERLNVCDVRPQGREHLSGYLRGTLDAKPFGNRVQAPVRQLGALPDGIAVCRNGALRDTRTGRFVPGHRPDLAAERFGTVFHPGYNVAC